MWNLFFCQFRQKDVTIVPTICGPNKEAYDNYYFSLFLFLHYSPQRKYVNWEIFHIFILFLFLCFVYFLFPFCDINTLIAWTVLGILSQTWKNRIALPLEIMTALDTSMQNNIFYFFIAEYSLLIQLNLKKTNLEF